MSKKLLLETFLLMGLSILGVYDGVRLLKGTPPFYDPLGAGGFLIFISGMLLICTVVYLLTHLKHERTATRKQISLHISTSTQVLVILIIYAVTVSLLGYFLSTAFFFVFGLHIFGVSSWTRSIVIGLIFATAFYLVFSRVLGILFG